MRSCLIRVFGLVQGVGFRPYVARLATELHIGGDVCNSGGIVHINAYGSNEAMEEFLHRLSLLSEGNGILPGSVVADLVTEDVSLPGKEDGCMEEQPVFVIKKSTEESDVKRMLPVDFCTCRDCERQLREPGNRRYRYPLISCASCGPRFSIMTDVPYDREHTSLKNFELCDRCRAEYEALTDPRCFAQTIGCPDCGPKLHATVRAKDRSEFETIANAEAVVADFLRLSGEDALSIAVSYLKEGKILAVKDVGGYHFVFDPRNKEAAQRLRAFKNREQKPFAVIFPDVEAIRRVCSVSKEEEELLKSNPRPIVLVDINNITVNDIMSTESILSFSKRIGAMLPSNPIQILLTDACGPLVMTSGNRGGEPLEAKDEIMLTYLSGHGIDLVLSHEREILSPLDDGVCQVVKLSDGKVVKQILRRARGYVPEGIALGGMLSEDVFFAGGDLKAVFGLGTKDRLYLSGHFGDLEEEACIRRRKEMKERMEGLLNVQPQTAVCDLHPSYRSVEEAKKYETCYQVQHHMAHIGSVIAEHDLKGDVLGIAFDGTGYGTDGAIWGSEFFLRSKDAPSMKRIGHLAYIPLVGGDACARTPKLSALCFLADAAGRGLLKVGEHELYSDPQYAVVALAASKGINCMPSSSMGRLFDAAAALLGICQFSTFEGEAPMRLQQAAETYLEKAGAEIGSLKDMPATAGADRYLVQMSEDAKGADEKTASGGVYTIDGAALLSDLIREKNAGIEEDALAYAFHERISQTAAAICDRIKVGQVALSGGCMQNRLLLQLMYKELTARGIRVYTNEAVPAGDGGLALGQAYLYLQRKNGQ